MPTIKGTAKRDVLKGLAASEKILGLGGNDDLLGNGGNDTLDGGTGKDTMKGGQGNDFYIVDNSGDKVIPDRYHEDRVWVGTFGGSWLTSDRRNGFDDESTDGRTDWLFGLPQTSLVQQGPRQAPLACMRYDRQGS